MQVPPAYSAKKVGRTARLCAGKTRGAGHTRAGRRTADEGRPARASPAAPHAWPCRVRRASTFAPLRTRWAELVGTGACLESLRRTRSGAFDSTARCPSRTCSGIRRRCAGVPFRWTAAAGLSGREADRRGAAPGIARPGRGWRASLAGGCGMPELARSGTGRRGGFDCWTGAAGCSRSAPPHAARVLCTRRSSCSKINCLQDRQIRTVRWLGGSLRYSWAIREGALTWR